jgi:ribulose-5-phosphate 4-epimerase/fuculose-1-phosphate aldolase
MQFTQEEEAAATQLVAFTKRMVGRKLTTCLSGSFSIKVEDAVLITPKNVDLSELTVKDIVKLKDNVASNNALPSDDVVLHLEIYAQHHDIASIVMASPRYMMSYGVVHQTLETRVIPECYFMLTKVDSMAFDVGQAFNKKVAAHFNEQQPTLLIQHDKYIVTASSIMLAYDRLEVAEATAEGLITTLPIAPLVQIQQHEIEKFDRIKFPHLFK